MKCLPVRQAVQLTAHSRITIYRLELAGEFPKRRQLSKNSVAGSTPTSLNGQSRDRSAVYGNNGRAGALAWCDLRLSQRGSANLTRDRPSA
ncbi:MAG: AlpA family phage regulatory protein [Mycobacteriales bacterium]